MKMRLVKKGEKFGFHKKESLREFYDVRGRKAEITEFCKKEGLEADIHPTTGSHSPIDEWYGMCFKKTA